MMRSMMILLFLAPVLGLAQPWTLERVSSTSWRLTVIAEAPALSLPSGTPAYSVIRVPGFESLPLPGVPALPVAVLRFALPGSGRPSVKILQVTEGTMSFASLQGFPGPGSAPKSFVEFGTAFEEQGSPVIECLVRPVLMTGPRTCRYLTRLVAMIDLGDARMRSMSVSANRQKLQVANAQDAGTWQREILSTATSTWFVSGVQALRVETREEGIHRITGRELEEAGVPVRSLSASAFRLVHDGEEEPLLMEAGADDRIDPEDFVLFHAERIRGEAGEWFNPLSDDNVYWVLWNGGPGLRYGTESGDPSGEPLRSSIHDTVHLEQDLQYHAGDNDYESSISEKVEGEGWIWAYLRTYDSLGVKIRDSLRIPFDVNLADGSPVVFRYRVRGSSRDQSRLRILLNDSTVVDRLVGGRENVVAELLLPPGLLHRGANTLTFRSVGAADCLPGNTDCPIERLYVDWADFVCDLDLEAHKGRLAAEPDSTLGEGRRRLLVSGFTASPLYILNLTAGTVIKGSRVTGATGDMHLEAALVPRHRYAIADSTDCLVPRIRLTTLEAPSQNFQAKYLVLTHADFLGQARRLADYRSAKNGWSTAVVDVQDVYNEFGYGRKTTDAIIRFMKAVHGTGVLEYVVILGDASWDPKRNRPSSDKQDFIPTVGNPANDNAYVAMDSGTVNPRFHIGRIPAETSIQAQAYIDKLISYEQLPPQAWNRVVLFAVGGKTTYERDQLFLPQAKLLIQRYLDPFCLDPHMIVKKRLDIVSYDDLDTLITEMNRGVLWFNFTGHGGTRIIDMGVERPDIFATRDKYPFFVTLSCNTAHFAEPFETGLNEKFAMAEGNGAIASYGTSGLGVVSYDDLLSRYMFSGLTEQRLETWGAISTHAKQRLLQNSGSGNQLAINTVNQYVILGDPAARIPLVRGPELFVEPSDIDTDMESVFEGQPAVITTTIHNAGLCLNDSVDVDLRLTVGNTPVADLHRRVAPFSNQVSIDWDVTVRNVTGRLRMQVEIDPAGRIMESTRANNIAVAERSVLPRGAAAILPLDHAVLAAVPEFVVANPSILPGGPDATGRVEVEWSKDPEFRTPGSVFQAPLGLMASRLPPPAAGVTSAIFWRARVISGPMTTSWTTARSFRLDPSSLDEQWLQRGRVQWERSEHISTAFTATEGLTLGSRDFPVEVVSAGNNQVEIQDFAEIILNGVNVSVNRRGFNLAVFDPRTGVLRDTVHFDTYADRSQAAAMVAYLQSLSPELMLACAVRDDANGHPDFTAGGTNITPELREAMALFGARLIDSLGFRDSYAFLGSRDNPSGAREDHRRYGAAFFKDTLKTLAPIGIVRSPVIGPASSWTSLAWEGRTGASGSVNLEVLAPLATGDSVLVRGPSVQPGAALSLATIDPVRFPRLRVRAVLVDSGFTRDMEMFAWSMRFASHVPECGMTNQVMTLDQDSVEQGAEARLRFIPINAGRADAREQNMAISVTSGGRVVSSISVPVDIPLTTVPNRTYDIPISTDAASGDLTVECRLGTPPHADEYYDGNNLFVLSLRVGKDSERPSLAVIFDGQPIADEDPVAPSPVIGIVLRDASPLPVSDTSAVQVFLDGRRIWMTNNPEIELVNGMVDEEKVRIRFTPTLTAGYHTLAVSAKDASGNPADSIPYQVRFRVETENRVENVVPFPNPSSGPVDLTFSLVGQLRPDDASIKIYTIAGRLIRDINVMESLRIGFNRITWDLRDQDGDIVGNGVYFYRLRIRRGQEVEEHRGTIAIAK